MIDRQRERKREIGRQSVIHRQIRRGRRAG